MKKLIVLLALLFFGAPAYGQDVHIMWQCASSGFTQWCYPSATNPLPVTESASTTNGATPFHLVAANSNNSTALKASPGTVYGVQVFGIGSAPAYLKFYDKASAPTCASDAVVTQVMIPAASTAANGAGAVVSVSVGKKFSAGIAFCIVTGIADNDNTSVAAATFVVNIDYK